MNTSTQPDGKWMSIAEVERETGLPRATVRMWERRYGFPAPARDERGERSYDAAQVAQLRLMQRLVQQGHRPAKLVAAGAQGIRELAAPAPAARSRAASPQAAALLRVVKQHDVDQLKLQLLACLRRVGLEQFVAAQLPAFNALIGDAWSSGELQVHEEHLYSHVVYDVVREAIAAVAQPVRDEAPLVLLTTVPQEYHGLGLLMAHAMFALQGCQVVSLGVRLPLDQIAAAAQAYKSDLVGLSFTGALGTAHVLRSLEELRGMLPPQVRLWAGGSNPALHKRTIAGVRSIKDVLAIPAMLAEDFALPPVAAARAARKLAA
ncbi:MerR family transcriptional regulator [Caenimonas koreensis DSM 17982]|uniref:MerR family transcriptional regulator n=1 Tax=Caenimonas koreensis DSM 17982 TaxID=1121255 RepID=A0A844AZ64_9BURK|nr:MerR family transcriptional regulator [Caenimonas koreensis]MRD46352.1 MerR family transcriptional regulator [Caenimonas koreensis DSM 17982]